MPRFFFDSFDDDLQLPDAEGQEFADFMAVKNHAAVALARIAADALPKGGMEQTFAFHIRDEAGHVVLVTTLIFRAVVP